MKLTSKLMLIGLCMAMQAGVCSAEKPHPVTKTGQVVDLRTGKPIPNAKVETVTYNAQGEWYIRMSDTGVANTDARGMFTLVWKNEFTMPGMYGVGTGGLEDYHPNNQIHAVCPPDKGFVVRLVPRWCYFKGVVKDKSTGSPIAGAEVSLGRIRGEVINHVRTDAEGRFSIETDWQGGKIATYGQEGRANSESYIPPVQLVPPKYRAKLIPITNYNFGVTADGYKLFGGAADPAEWFPLLNLVSSTTPDIHNYFTIEMVRATVAFGQGTISAKVVNPYGNGSSGQPEANIFDGHRYEVVSVPGGISWADAKLRAVQMGGYLACITSAQEDAFIARLADSDKYWSPGRVHGPHLGGYQATFEDEPTGGWSWVSGEPWGYENWFEGNPSNDGNTEDYLAYVIGSKWNDIDTSVEDRHVSFVVEYDNSSANDPNSGFTGGEDGAGGSVADPFEPEVAPTVIKPSRGAEIAEFVWIGEDADKVGSWNTSSPDGRNDGHFRLKLAGLAPVTEIRSINIYVSDPSGNKGESYWYTQAGASYILGAFHNGVFLNPDRGMSLGYFSGKATFDLFASDAGASGSSHFIIEVDLAGKILRKIAQAK